MAAPIADPVTPEELYPEFFCEGSDAVKRVTEHRFEPIARTKKQKAMIRWMLSQSDDLVPDGCLGCNVDAKPACKKQLQNLLEGKQMTFEQKVYGTDATLKLKIGRRCSPYSTQMLWSSFRATIFHKFFSEEIRDSDAKKQNSTGCIYLCKKVGLDPNVFEKYVSEADTILEDFKPADGKSLFNMLMTLGGIKGWQEGKPANVIPAQHQEFVTQFKNKAWELCRALKEKLPLIYDIIEAHRIANPKKDKHGNIKKPFPDSSFQSLVLNHIEDKMLCEVVAASWDLSGQVYDLFFDGFGNNLSDQQLNQANNVVRGVFSVNITYRNKPFPPALDMPEDLRCKNEKQKESFFKFALAS